MVNNYQKLIKQIKLKLPQYITVYWTSGLGEHGKNGKRNQSINISIVEWYLTLYTQYQQSYSPYCSLNIYNGANKKNLSNNQELL